jgi:hypothetical protein
MAKITDGNSLNEGVELTIDTTAKTFTLNQAGNLVYKDGVTLQALYSKFIKLWETSAKNRYPFPMYVIDAKSGQFQFGTDGGSYNGWKPANNATRQALRDGGWSEYDSSGNLTRQHVGIVSLGNVNDGAQLYYQKVQGGSPINFTFTDEVNEGIQVFGDTNNGNFDTRTFFKAFTREYGKKYKSSTLADTAQSGTGAYTVNVLISNEDDTKIQAPDASMTAAPYDKITVTYYNTDQNEAIGSGSYPFRVVIDGNGATLEQIYTKAQYLLRQTTDIDSGTGTVIGKTADELCYFLGDTLITTTGVFITNIQANDINRIQFTDYNGVARTYPYSSAGTITFNTPLTTGGAGYYIMYFLDTVNGDYGTSAAIVVNDKDGAPIQGTITGSSVSFTFDYSNNNQGGRTPGTDAQIVIVAGNKGHAKPVVVNGVIGQAKGIAFACIAEADRAYIG